MAGVPTRKQSTSAEVAPDAAHSLCYVTLGERVRVTVERSCQPALDAEADVCLAPQGRRVAVYARGASHVLDIPSGVRIENIPQHRGVFCDHDVEVVGTAREFRTRRAAFPVRPDSEARSILLGVAPDTTCWPDDGRCLCGDIDGRRYCVAGAGIAPVAAALTTLVPHTERAGPRGTIRIATHCPAPCIRLESDVSCDAAFDEWMRQRDTPRDPWIRVGFATPEAAPVTREDNVTSCGPVDLMNTLGCAFEWDAEASVPAHWLMPTERYVESSFARRCNLRSPRALACMASSSDRRVRGNLRFTRQWIAMLRTPGGAERAERLVWSMRRRSQDGGFTVVESEDGCVASGAPDTSSTTPPP